jgi:uncharacterized protein (DUF3084 family)
MIEDIDAYFEQAIREARAAAGYRPQDLHARTDAGMQRMITHLRAASLHLMEEAERLRQREAQLDQRAADIEERLRELEKRVGVGATLQ